MAGGDGVNQVGGGSVQPQPQSFDEGVHQAKNPQRLNRSSIESLPDTERKLPSSSEEAKEFPPLSARKVTRQAPGKFRLLLSRPKKPVSMQDLGGVKQQNKLLSKMFERQAPKIAQNKPQAEQQVKDLEDGLKWAKSNHSKTAKLASSALLKLSVADKAGVPPQLTTVEKAALQEFDHSQELVEQFKGKLTVAKADKSEFKTVEKLKDSFASRLEKLERKISEASKTVNAKFTPLSVNDHKSRVSDLEKKLAAVETALKNLNQLGQNVAGAEETHPGSTPKNFDDKVQKLATKAEAVRGKGPEVLGKAKNKRDQVLQQQADIKKTAKQEARDKKEMDKAYKDLDKLQPVKKKPLSRSKSVNSGLSGKTNWSPEDQALANRLKRLRGQITHDTITSSGNAKKYAQLERQLHNISSVDDLKAVVADRRASKITPDQQRKYLGLLNAAVQGMVKNPQFAEKMNDDLIKDVLKEQPSEARAAIKQLYNSYTDSLQRRLDRLRGR